MCAYAGRGVWWIGRGGVVEQSTNDRPVSICLPAKGLSTSLQGEPRTTTERRRDDRGSWGFEFASVAGCREAVWLHNASLLVPRRDPRGPCCRLSTCFEWVCACFSRGLAWQSGRRNKKSCRYTADRHTISGDGRGSSRTLPIVGGNHCSWDEKAEEKKEKSRTENRRPPLREYQTNATRARGQSNGRL